MLSIKTDTKGRSYMNRTAKKKSHRGMATGRKHMWSGVVCLLLVCSLMGCTLPDRGDGLAGSNRTEKEMGDQLMQNILDALEAKDADAIRNLFSDYALEHAENIDERIEELIRFYPGCDEYAGNVPIHRTAERGEIIYVLMPEYKVTVGDEVYQMCLTTQIENDIEPDKVGLYSIQVMTEEAKPEGFYWRDEMDEPGVYVLE